MKKQIGWKKVCIRDLNRQPENRRLHHVILKLEIIGSVIGGDRLWSPIHEDPTRKVLNVWRKCRTSHAKVLAVYGLKSKRKIKNLHRKMLFSMHDYEYEYRLGKIQEPKLPFIRSKNACSSGIHFFEIRAWAENW